MIALSPTPEERADGLADALLDRDMVPILTHEARALIADAIRLAISDATDRAAKSARLHKHHALWIGLLDFGWDEKTECFGRGLAARIEADIRQQPFPHRGDSRPIEAQTEKTYDQE